MKSLLCICNGMIRSGSTWSFNVCREIVQATLPEKSSPTQSGYFESSQLEEFVKQRWSLAGYPVVIKAHSLGPTTMTALRAATAKAVCTYRDPRDCIASDIAFMKYPLEISLKRVSSTIEPFRMYQVTQDILMIKYEQMILNPKREIQRIATHLGLHTSDSIIDFVHAKTNIAASKELCESLHRRSPEHLFQLGDHLIDPTTHLHQNHINGGTVGRWKYELSPDQIAYTTEFFAPWLIKLGYETEHSVQKLMHSSTEYATNSLTTCESQFLTA